MPPAVLGSAPVEFLQLVGHPLRWQLLRELGRSDRTVQELTERVGEAQNLVSYHLAQLRRADLVSARRSTADGRDSYYTVDLGRIGELMTATARALHPGLRSALASGPPVRAPGRVGAGRRPFSVLFLCTGNSARSQMAEALIRQRSGGAVRAYSAGSRPKPLHANAVRVMRDDYGIDIAGQTSKDMSTFVRRRLDRVVTLCDRVKEVCPDFPGGPEAVHWSIPDPSAGGDDDQRSYPAFQQAAAELDTRIGFLLAVIPNGTAVP